jgi:hypothetical protein
MENEIDFLMPGTGTATATAADDLQALTPAPEEPAAGGSSRAKALKAVGIVTTAAIVGAIGVATLQGSSSANPTTLSGPAGAPGQGAPAQGGLGGGGRGGFDNGLIGTVSKVSATSITVAGTDGTTTTVKVTSATQVVENGATASLSAVDPGDTVFVHTEGTGASRYAERIMLGGFRQRGQGGPGFGQAPTQPGTGQAPAQTGTTSVTGSPT